MPQSQPSWIGRSLGDRYLIEEQLGAGGMSTVYRATDPNLQRSVAVKLIHTHLSSDPSFVRRFEQEASLVAQLRHPNIIQVFDFNHDGDVFYMVLEHVPGETMKARLHTLNEKKQRMPIPDIVRIIATVCDAVAFAHEREMIHRDLKPANVMLAPDNQPILMDFGVAKMLGGASHTSTGDIIGTALYMSPEQARGERPDRRSDIYSLGVMLYEMASGQRPFDGDSAVSVMLKHVAESVPDIRRIRDGIPDALVKVIEKALAKDPSDRFQTASEMANALRAIGVGAADATRRTKAIATDIRPKPSASSAGASRNRTLLIGGVALLAILVVGAIVVFGSSPQSEAVALPSAQKMVPVRAGVYLVGLDTNERDYATPRQANLKEYWIDQYEATNAQFAKFVEETAANPPVSWPGGAPPNGLEQHPVEGITWDQANAYCEWATKRLPSEAEWEVAARGAQGRLYPWGQDARVVELPRGGSYPVGSVSANVSTFGVYDMAGNVWEWVGEPYQEIIEGQRILHGGAHGFLKDMAYRLQGDPSVPTLIANAGVRCAATQVSGGENVVVPTPAPLEEDALFRDDFTNPNSGWPVGESGNYTFGYHPVAFYHLQVAAPDDHFTVAAPNLNVDNFSAESVVLIDHTDSETGNFRYGLALRQAGEDYYAFTISPRAKTWDVLKHTASGAESLASGNIDSLRGHDGADTLHIDANGPDFTFRINGQIVAQLNDSSYTRGDAGFYVETFDETLAHIHFKSLVVREAEPQLALYRDLFTNPNSGWPTGQSGVFTFGYHPPDAYHLEVAAPNDSLPVLLGGTFDDFSARSEVFVDHTNSDTGNFRYGLTVRRSDNHFYTFALSTRSATWQLLKGGDAGVEVLNEGSGLTLNGLAAIADVIRIDASGPNFAFFINDERVAELHDEDYSGGDVGFYLETFDETLAHVHFDSLELLPVEPFEVAVPIPDIPVPEGMLQIDAGYFLMGSSDGQANEQPEHPVWLDAYYMDVYEVTNAQYRACVESGACTASGLRDSFTHRNYRDDATYDNHPVIGVTWDQSQTYCSSIGKRLPTEAEWEYAAGGPENLKWPWGATFDQTASAAISSDVEAVGSFPSGASPFGAYDMGGNVGEWVLDAFNASFYADSPASNPINDSGDQRIYRGGSFGNLNGATYTTSRRFTTNRGFSDVDIGFRCAMDATEVNNTTPPQTREALVAEFCQAYLTYKPNGTCP